MLSQRQSRILETLVRSYIRDAVPVSSQEVVELLPFSISSATVRNELAALEEAGYLAQPHTSAGRTPTLVAFRFMVAQLFVGFSEESPSVALDRCRDPERTARGLARAASSLAFVASSDRLSFAGFEFVFAAPELRDEQALEAFGRFLNEASEWEARLRQVLRSTIGIFVGDENPLFASDSFSVAAARLPRRGVIALVGPVRMDYERAMTSLLRLIE